jgi:hypothetical protein
MYSNLKSCCTILISSSTLCPCLSSRTPPRSRGLRARTDPNPARLLDDETRSFLRISGESDGGGSTLAAARFTDADTSVEDTRAAAKWQVAFARSRSLSQRRVSPTASAVAAQSVPPGPVGAAACATEREATRAGEMRRRPRRRVRAVHGEATAGSPSSSSGLWASGSTRGLPSCRSRRSDGSLSATAHARQVATWSSPSDFSGFHRRATRLEVGGSDEGIRGAARRVTREQLLLCSYPSGLSRRRASIRCTSGPSVRNLAFALRGRRQRMPIPAREACRVHQELPRWIMDGWSYCSVHSEAVAR